MIGNSMINWWGMNQIAHNQVGCWQIGPLSIWIQRMRGEWCIAYASGKDPLDATLRKEMPCEIEDISDKENYTRFIFSSESEQISFSPVLADRSVVTKSEKPMSVPPEEEIEVYVSTPLWVRIETTKPTKTLLEIPTFRPSDTWFGPDTLEGELCYSSKTFHHLQLAQVPIRPHRATTCVLVRNRSDSILSLERMQVPVTHLQLFQRQDNRIWTDDVIFTRSGRDDFASLRTRASSHQKHGDQTIQIASPRQRADENLMVRAFSSIFR